MKDFLHYILNEVKNKRLSKADAIDLICQFQTPNVSSKPYFLSPLLHQNTSNLSEQRFSSTFTGGEFFLKDHVIKEQIILPGVAYVEMARAAMEFAGETFEDDKTKIRLKNIIWEQPIIIEKEPVQVHIGLFPEAGGEIAYEIYTHFEENPLELVVHSRGSAKLYPAAEIETLDLKALQAQCSKSNLSSNQEIDNTLLCQGIEAIYIGAGQVLAKLVPPSTVLTTFDQFVLHPSIMELAIQASLGLMGKGDLKLSQPKTLQEIEIIGKCTTTMWALVRYSNSGGLGNNPQRFDIDICDEHGIICARMKGLELQENVATINLPVQARIQDAPASKIQETFELMTYKETWQEQALPEIAPVGIKTIVCFLSNLENQQAITTEIQIQDRKTKVIYISQNTSYQKKSEQEYLISRKESNTYARAFQSILEDNEEIDAVLYLWPLEDQSCIQDYSPIVNILQAIVKSKLKVKQILLGAQVKDSLERCYMESWIGFERSVGLVLPNTQIAAIFQHSNDQNEKTPIRDWLSNLWPEMQIPKSQSVLYQDGKRKTLKIQPTTIESGSSMIRTGGTYLITGGCGGLGLLFAKYFAKKYSVNLILTGRSPLNEEKQLKIKALEALGSRIMYVQADVCDLLKMKKGLNKAKEKFGKIHGAIHAAGTASNQNILEKDIQSFQAVLDPKIKGTLVLDKLFEAEAIDFMCYFSSSSAILGDFGSCDYSIANRFLMAHADYRNHGPRQEDNLPCKTIVINWPQWKYGMGFNDNESAKMYLKSSGQRYLETEEDIAMIERLLADSNTHHIVFAGEPNRVKSFLGLIPDQPATSASINTIPSRKGRWAEMKGFNLEQCVEWDLKEHISILLKIPLDKLDREDNFVEFGFNSITLRKFATLLSSHYEIEITPAIFFGYFSIEKLIQYLTTKYQDTIREYYQEDIAMESISQVDPVITSIPKNRESKKSRFNGRNVYQNVPEPIAIIGMSGRFPKANTVEELWNSLKDGENCITEIPADRWNWQDYYSESHQQTGKTNSKWGGFIADIDQFDPLFFEIAPKEAEVMDPRQRLFLEEAWHALEDAGYMGERIKGKSCGVYVGVEEGEYGYLSGDQGQINSNQNATLPARIAYKLDLKGPNLALTAACSSGLVAIHQACQALRQGDCEMALVGGVSLLITPGVYLWMSQMDMLSPDGKCYVFDQRASGMIPGEAVAVVLLKPLSKAILDQDQIYGCIKASGVNCDGKTNGINAPSLIRQADLIKDIYEKYHINPDNIQYVLAHSLGLSLGDSIEFQALSDAFGKYTHKKQYCTLGSIKPLIGHTFAASGVVSLISMLMAMKNKIIPATHNYEHSNEFINLKDSPFIVNQENQIWATKNNQPRTGTVSTTGNSGTNAHVVIEEYIPFQEAATPVCVKISPQIVVFSAKNHDRLWVIIQQMLEFVEMQKDFSLPNLAYTLQIGREAMESRFAMVVNTQAELIQGLKAYLQSVKDGKEITISMPIFTGDLEEEDSGVRSLVTGETAETVLQIILTEHNLEKLALHWTQGGYIPWETLHQGSEVRRVSLPTYPFARERYWISIDKEKQHRSDLVQQFTEEKPQLLINTSKSTQESIQDYIIEYLAFGLNLARDQIKLNKNIQAYGVDSIIMMKLIRDFGEYFQIEITAREMLEYRTIKSLSIYLAKKIEQLNPQEVVIDAQSETTPLKVSEPIDEQVVELLEKLTLGNLDLEETQKLIERKKIS